MLSLDHRPFFCRGKAHAKTHWCSFKFVHVEKHLSYYKRATAVVVLPSSSESSFHHSTKKLTRRGLFLVDTTHVPGFAKTQPDVVLSETHRLRDVFTRKKIIDTSTRDPVDSLHSPSTNTPASLIYVWSVPDNLSKFSPSTQTVLRSRHTDR